MWQIFTRPREHVHSGNTASHYREKLEHVKRDFSQLPLPQSHEQFIAQAALYQFIEEMDRYLEIKQSFKGLKAKKSATVVWTPRALP